MQRSFSFFAAAVLFAAGLSSTLPVAADSSIGAGYFAPTPAQKSLGVIATTGLTLPVVPIAPEVAVALPFSGGRYAVTGEARIGNPGTYVGGGIGVARLSDHGSSGTIYDVFAGKRVAPLTTVEARFYGFGSDRAGTTGYLGLRISI